MLVRDSATDVDHREQHKNIGLQETHKQVQADKNDGDDEFSQRNKSQVNLFAGKHIGVKTNGERKRPGEVADDFDRQHQWRQQDHRPQELFDIAATIRTKPGRVIEEERYHCQAKGNVRIHGGGFKTRYQPEQIHEQDKEEESAEERCILRAIMPHHLFRGSMDELVGEFHEVLDLSWTIYGQPTTHQTEEEDDKENNQKLADHPVAPRVGRITLPTYKSKHRVGRAGQVLIKKAGNPEFFHLVRTSASPYTF